MSHARHPGSPTIALFLKAPRLGAVKSRLAASLGEAAAAAIYRRLAERQLRALPAGWPVAVHFDPPEARPEMTAWLGAIQAGLRFAAQCPGDLGERLVAAFAAEFAGGVPAVIAIGGDCPGLDATVLTAARDALIEHDAVLGPAVDGGYYLIGLKACCPAVFASIAWGTASVLEQTRARLRESKLHWSELPVLEDVDDEAAWARARL